jgi:hypothetical protein
MEQWMHEYAPCRHLLSVCIKLNLLEFANKITEAIHVKLRTGPRHVAQGYKSTCQMACTIFFQLFANLNPYFLHVITNVRAVRPLASYQCRRRPANVVWNWSRRSKCVCSITCCTGCRQSLGLVKCVHSAMPPRKLTAKSMKLNEQNYVPYTQISVNLLPPATHYGADSSCTWWLHTYRHLVTLHHSNNSKHAKTIR